jgi:hypothetical protein
MLELVSVTIVGVEGSTTMPSVIDVVMLASVDEDNVTAVAGTTVSVATKPPPTVELSELTLALSGVTTTVVAVVVLVCTALFAPSVVTTTFGHKS